MDNTKKTAEELELELESLRKKVASLESGELDRNTINEVLSRFCESTYSTIFNAASDAIFISDIEGAKIIDANDKACETFSVTAIGTSGSLYITPVGDQS